MKKNCLKCSKEFTKNYYDSNKYWECKRFCSSKCAGLFNNTAQKLVGRKRPTNVVEIMRRTMFKKGMIPWNKGIPFLNLRGKNHPNWKGGVTHLRRGLRDTLEYKQWRKSVFERDDYTCQSCFKRGGELQADHIKPWSTHPELRTSLSNGRTMCKECHMKTETWGGKATRFKLLV